MIRIIAVLTGAAGLFIFILPVFTGRILHIGNIAGTAVSACLLLYGIENERIRAMASAAWRSGALPRAALILAGSAAAAIAVTTVILTVMIVKAAGIRPSSDAPVIVLGCQVKGERPSLMLTGRMDAAIRYLQDHPDVLCVVSGGKGDGEMITEAECMFRYMTARGIEPDRILCEDRSTSTRENLLFSLQILREKGLQDIRDVALVTNEFHACRAHLIAKKLGLKAGIVPAASPWWLLPSFYVRELFGLLYQIFL